MRELKIPQCHFATHFKCLVDASFFYAFLPLGVLRSGRYKDCKLYSLDKRGNDASLYDEGDDVHTWLFPPRLQSCRVLDDESD